MKTLKFLSIAAIATAISACSSSTADKASGETCDTATCATHNHHEHGHSHAHGEACDNAHNHEMVVVGIAQEGDYKSGKITIATINGNEKKEFDYTKSNQDKMAAWQAGDTVSIFFDHHHHGEASHDSITAIKLGIAKGSAKSHSHEKCDEHDHNHVHVH